MSLLVGATVTASAHAPALGFRPRSDFDHIWAIGDLHADLTAAVVCLRDLARVAHKDERGVWTWVAPPRTCVVVLGDTVDRRRPGTKLVGLCQWGVGEQADEEEQLLRLLHHLHLAAPSNGGAVVMLMGNHELANLAPSMDERHVRATCTGRFASPRAARRRVASFREGGEMFGLIKAMRPLIVAQVGAWVFVHAGVNAEHVRFAEEHGGGRRHLYAMVNGWVGDALGDASLMGKKNLDSVAHLVAGKGGLCEYRGLSGDRDCHLSEDVATVALRALSRHNAKHGLPAAAHIVMGHSCQFSRNARQCGAAEHARVTSQDDVSETLSGLEVTDSVAFGINATPNGAAWRCDVGASRAMETPDNDTWGVHISHEQLEDSRRPAVLHVDTTGAHDITSTVRATARLEKRKEPFGLTKKSGRDQK
jgi:hypothetical protein